MPFTEFYTVLSWDSTFFGFGVARLSSDFSELSLLPEILNHLRKLNVKLVYWPSQVTNLMDQEKIMLLGGKLVDLKTTFRISLNDESLKKIKHHPEITPYTGNTSNEDLIQLAIDSGMYSRFKYDDCIPDEKFRKLYKEWMIASVEKKMAREVLVSKENQVITGMITVTEKKQCGSIGLIAVNPQWRNRGIGDALIEASLHWFFTNGLNDVEVVTQGANKAACRLYEKHQFQLVSAEPYFHFWL